MAAFLLLTLALGEASTASDRRGGVSWLGFRCAARFYGGLRHRGHVCNESAERIFSASEVCASAHHLSSDFVLDVPFGK